MCNLHVRKCTILEVSTCGYKGLNMTVQVKIQKDNKDLYIESLTKADHT